jgi:hypothetical protein
MRAQRGQIKTSDHFTTDDLTPSLIHCPAWFSRGSSRDAVEDLKTRYPRSNLTRADVSAIRRLRKMPIVIRPADKNLGVTAMSVDWYNAEVHRQLTSDTYRLMTSGPPQQAVAATRRALAKIVGKRTGSFTDVAEAMDPKLPAFLRMYANPKSKTFVPKIPRFYLLPKLHKTPPKGRPIVASLQWITTPASKALDYYLQPLVNNVADRVLKDTRQLINKLERLHVPADAILFTADVESLYTNIPVEDCKEAIRYWLVEAQRRGQLDKEHLPWWRDSLVLDAVISFLQQLVDLVFRYNFFTTGFDDDGNTILYRQASGMAMGTQFAPCGANLYMAYKEDQAYKINSRIADQDDSLYLWLRYIDDIVGIWLGTRAALDAFLESLNDPDIRLTHEVSTTAVDFMDLHIHKGPRFQRARRLDLRVHRKRLNRYLYLPWTSAHPTAQKAAFLKGELIRFIRNSSSFEAFLNDLALFARALRARGYPAAFIRDNFSAVTYSDRPKYLQLSKSNSNRSPLSPFVLVSEYNPLTQRVGERQLLALTRTQVHAVAAETPGIVDEVADPSRRWIKANTLPRRLAPLLRKTWPPSFDAPK